MTDLSLAPKEIDGHGLLAGKVVLVTAAAGTGIGSSTARRALAEGADVVVSDYHERRLGETRDELAGLGSAALTPWRATSRRPRPSTG